MPSASGVYLSAGNFLVGTFQERKRFLRTKKGCEIVHKPTEAASAMVSENASRNTFCSHTEMDRLCFHYV